MPQNHYVKVKKEFKNKYLESMNILKNTIKHLIDNFENMGSVKALYSIKP